MSARGTLAWKRQETSVSRDGWLATGLERLALAAFIITILLLGYWNIITPGWFAKSWDIGSQYQLVTLFNSQLQTVILFPSDIAAAATIIFWGLGRIVASITHQERAPLRFGPRYVALPLIGLAALSALSATQAILAILSLEIALHLLLVAALVIAVTNLRPPLWAIVAPLALLLACEGALSLAQALAQSTLLGYLPFSWGLTTVAAQPEASIVQLPNGARWLRAYGTFPHPNILGGFLCLAIPVVAGAYLHLPWRKSISRLLLASLALGGLALFLSFSRAAWLGIVISALWAGLLLRQKRRAAQAPMKHHEFFEARPNQQARGEEWGLVAPPSRRPGVGLPQRSAPGGDVCSGAAVGRQDGGATSPPLAPNQPDLATRSLLRKMRTFYGWGEAARPWLRPIILCLLGVGLLVGLVTALGPVVQSRLLLNNVPLEQRSLDERVVLLEASALFFTQHPWLGVGAGNMPLVELSYPPTRNIGEPAHNVPVAIAVETGFFGLLLWLVPPLGVLWLAWRRRRAGLSAAGLTASAALMALLTVAQLDHYLWTQPIGSLIWWLAVALAALWGERISEATTQ